MIIGIYPRKSVYRDNSESIKVQIKLCKEYAKIVYKGQQIDFRIYGKDEGFSGKNTNRPSFQELMRDVKSNILNVVMVYRLDRISRNVSEFSEMYDIMHAHNVTFLSVKESFDTSTPIGRTVMYILAAFSQFERESTSERVADNMHSLGASGKWTGGKLPAGMSSIRKTVDGKEHSFLVVNDERIGLVKMLYSMYLERYTITALERYCRDHGFRTESGKFLSTSQIHCILSNPVYCSNGTAAYDYFKGHGHTVPDKLFFDGTKGLVSYGKTKQSEKRIVNDKYTISVGIHEPVIAAEDWIAVQNRFGANKFYRSNKYKVGILKGVLKCNCGARMDIRTYVKNGNQFSYYYCARMAREGKKVCDTGYIRVDTIDDAFISKLMQIKSNPSMIKVRATELDFVDINKIEAELKSIDQAIENLTGALSENSSSTAASHIIKQIEKLDASKVRLESSLYSAMQNNKIAQSEKETKDIIYNYICCLLEKFESMSYQEKNELIKKAVKKCICSNDGLHIIF